MNIILWQNTIAENTFHITYYEATVTYCGANAYNGGAIMMFSNNTEINVKFVMQGIESAIRITYAQDHYECKILNKI